MFLKFRAFYLFKRERGRKPQNLSYSLQILLLAFCSCRGGKKKPTRGESKHFTGKYTLASSHPHLRGENKYLLRNGLKTFFVEYCFLGAGVGCHMAPGWILDFLGFFAGWLKKETNRGAVGAAGLWGVLWSCLIHGLRVPVSILVPFPGDCVCSEYSLRLPSCLKSPNHSCCKYPGSETARGGGPRQGA